MEGFEVKHEGGKYKIQPNESGYLVTFPDGHQALLEAYLDSNQETAFAFDMKLAESLGHQIRKKQHFE